MVGKAGYSYKGKQYRNYYCSKAMRSRGMCSYYNGHSAAKLENMILDYLGQFSDPIRVREYLAIAESKDTERYEAELRRIEKRLKDMDTEFLSRLNDLLKRKILTEEEFAQANEASRSQKADLEVRKAELTKLIKQAKSSEAMIQKIPQAIKTFTEAFKSLEPRQQKAHLQTILSAARIYNDGLIELEFRGED